MGKKRMFGICNAMCSSSASVGENLCGVLELAKGVGTIEKLWCICSCSSREAPSLRTVLAFPRDTLGCRWIKGRREEGTCCRTFSVLKDTDIKLHFQAILFYRLLQCGDSEAMGGSCPSLFFLLVTTHWEWKPECLRHLCIFTGLQWLSASQRWIWLVLNLRHKLGQNPEIIYGNAMVYQEIMPFFTSIVFITERQASCLVLLA